MIAATFILTVAALISSSYLVNGMRSVKFLFSLYFRVFVGMSACLMLDCIRVLSNPRYVLFATVVGSGLLVLYLRRNTTAAITDEGLQALYMNVFCVFILFMIKKIFK